MKYLPLNAEQLLREATAESGLGSYLDEAMEQRFHRLMNEFNNFGSIREDAYPAAVEQIKGYVTKRLKVARDWEQYPQILDEKIVQPFFVIGNARAGTTFAQSILTLDEGHRTPCYWDVRNPSPPPGMDAAADAAAHAEVDEFLDYMLGKSPGLWQAHPYFDQRGYTEAEDEFLYSLDFTMAYPLHFLKVPSLPRAAFLSEPSEVLQFHKNMLKQLQWKIPTGRWVGKGVRHQYLMDSLLKVYPDAVCFWMHRAPEEYIGSLLELLVRQYQPFNGELFNVQPQEIVDGLRSGIDMYMNQPSFTDPRVHHIRFRDFVSDPAAVIAPIYEKSGIPFTRSYEQQIKNRTTDPAFRADRHGKFEYSLAKFGLTREALREKFKAYCDYFDL